MRPKKFGAKSIIMDGEAQFAVKIQDQEFHIPYGKWYEVKFFIKPVEGDKYWMDSVIMKKVPEK